MPCARTPAIEVLCSHSVVGCYADNELAVARIDREDGGLTLLRAAAVVLATRRHRAAGRVPQQRSARRAAGLGGATAAVPAMASAWATASRYWARTRKPWRWRLDLASQGLKVTDLLVPAGAPLDARPRCRPRCSAAGLRVHGNVQDIAAVAGSDGTLAARGMEIRWPAGRAWTAMPCCVSTGWMPALQLLLARGGTLRFDAALGQHVPACTAPRCVRGRSRQWLLRLRRAHRRWRAAGERAAQSAARAQPRIAPTAAPRDTHSHSHRRAAVPSPGGKEFVDLDEDLTLADLANAAQEGFDSVELLKRYSTRGHGALAGQAVEPQRRAAAGARHRPRTAFAGAHHRAAALATGEPRRTGRRALLAAAPHRAGCVA